MTRPVAALAGLVLGSVFAIGCASTGDAPPVGYDPAAIDPSIYDRVDDPNDPYRGEYARFRARRARDMASPDSPRPLPRHPNRHLARARVWWSPRCARPAGVPTADDCGVRLAADGPAGARDGDDSKSSVEAADCCDSRAGGDRMAAAVAGLASWSAARICCLTAGS